MHTTGTNNSANLNPSQQMAWIKSSCSVKTHHRSPFCSLPSPTSTFYVNSLFKQHIHHSAHPDCWQSAFAPLLFVVSK